MYFNFLIFFHHSLGKSLMLQWFMALTSMCSPILTAV